MKTVFLILTSLFLCFTSVFSQTPEELEVITKMASDPNTKPEDMQRYMAQIAFNKRKVAGAKEFTKVEDQGITNDLHARNVGKIVFSNSEIVKSETSDAKFKTSFANLSGGVYGRIYLSQSVRNALADLGAAETAGRSYIIEYFIDGQLTETAYNNSLDDVASNTWTTWQIVPAPVATDDYKYGNSVSGFLETLKKTAPGKHKVKVIVAAEYPDPLAINTTLKLELANGEFELTFSQTEKDAFIKNHEPKISVSSSSSKSTSSVSSGSSSGIDAYGNIKFEMYNKTSATIQGKIVGPNNNGSRDFSLNGNSHSSFDGKVGGKIVIKGQTYRTLSAGDNKGTIELK